MIEKTIVFLLFFMLSATSSAWAKIKFDTDIDAGKKVCIWAIHSDDPLHKILVESYLTKAGKDNPPKKNWRIKNQYRKAKWILKKALRLSSTNERRIEKSWYSADLELKKQTNDWPKKKVIHFRFIRLKKVGLFGCIINKGKSVFFSKLPPKKEKRTFKGM